MVEQSTTVVYSYPGTETPIVTYRVNKQVDALVYNPAHEDRVFLNDLLEEVRQVLWLAKKAPAIQESKLDRGFYVFAIMRLREDSGCSVAVYIGTADGSSRQDKSIFDLQRKYNGTSVLLLASGLSKVQAANIRRVLIRRLHTCENGKK
jgi:hypothetical protein